MRRVLLLAVLGIAANGEDPLRVQDHGKIAVMKLDDYVAGVVAAEAGLFRSVEALKAMAVAARTYAVRMKGRHAAQGFDLCGTTHCQALDRNGVTSRIVDVVAATRGELLWFEARPALAFYSASCGGRSEDGAVLGQPEIPYLRPRVDPYCSRNHEVTWQWLGDGDLIARALRHAGLRAPARIERITAAGQTASGRVASVVLAGAGAPVTVNATVLRMAISREAGWNTIRSDRWTVRGDGGRFLFQGSGAGHGAGMCQMGAEQMGIEGHLYREILAQYYPGVRVGVGPGGLKWTRIGGERVTVMTLHPSADAPLLSTAERLSRRLDIPPGVEVRVYPDVDAFRNATGEPGWVAAFTSGHTIHLQRRGLAGLEGTLRHEMLHIWVEDRAAPNLPLWFREGVTAFLDQQRGSGPAGAPPDERAMREGTDPVRARQAFAEARLRVTALVRQYGEAAVLGWLRTGLLPAL